MTVDWDQSPTGTDIVVYDPPKLLTEKEVRIAGATSNRLLSLRGFLAQGVAGGGSLTIKTRNGTQSLALHSVDAEALIALMIERDEALLVGLNIEIER